MDKKPTITIDGKKISPTKPKMKAWRKFLEFFDQDSEELAKLTLTEYTDALIELIQLSFNREEVTTKTIEENLSVSELRPLTLEIFAWLQTIFFSGVEEIPKNATAAADS